MIDTPNIPVDPPTRSSVQHLSVGEAECLRCGVLADRLVVVVKVL
jgi:hypothetical protein